MYELNNNPVEIIAYIRSEKGKREAGKRLADRNRTPKAREKARQNITAYNHSKKGKPLSEETKNKMSNSHKGQSNYWLKGKPLTDEHKKLISKHSKEFLRLNPDKHPCRIIGKNHCISKGQRILYNLIKLWYWPEAELNYPVRTNEGIRYCDVGIPSEKLDIEYDDAGYWHDDAEDNIRDLELKEVNWETVRIKCKLL